MKLGQGVKAGDGKTRMISNSIAEIKNLQQRIKKSQMQEEHLRKGLLKTDYDAFGTAAETAPELRKAGQQLSTDLVEQIELASNDF